MKTKSRRGLTLVELLIAVVLSGVVLASAMDIFLFIARSTVRVANYQAMEQQALLALEQLGRELRVASNLSTTTTGSVVTGVTLTIPNVSGTGSTSVAYSYDSSNGTFVRQSGGISKVLIQSIQSGSFGFQCFDQLQNPTTSDHSTKQMLIALTIAPATNGLVAATSKRVISSRFVLRNR